VPKIRLCACASVARFHEKVSKLLHLNNTASFVLLYLCMINCSLLVHSIGIFLCRVLKRIRVELDL
jgi:hypothetical protein